MDVRSYLRARERLLGLLLLMPMLLFGALFGVVLAFVGIQALERLHPEGLLPLLSVAATGIGIAWALSPLLAGVALTESHDMSRLLHFPIPLPTLVASSLVANLAQPLVVGELPVLIAVSLALGGFGPGLPFAALGVTLTFVLMLAVGQATGLVMQGVARNRRLQDVALFVGLGFGFALSVVPVLLIAFGARGFAAVVRALVETDVFALSPFAWGVRAAVHAGRGEPRAFVFWSALGLVAVGVTMAASSWLIHRIHSGELDLSPRGAGPNAHRARLLLPGRVGALIDKDLRVGWRDPALKATIFMGVVGPLIFLLFLSQTRAGGSGTTGLLFLSAMVGLTAFGTNVFGHERRGLALLLGFPLERFRLLAAKNLASIAFRLPGVLVVLVASVVLASPVLVPAALTVTLATLLIASAADNFVSILFPAAMPAPGRNPYEGASSGGRGLGALALSAALVPGIAIAAAPFAFLAWLPLLLESPWLWWGSLPLALAGAGAVYAMLTAGAARLLERREPELLERVLGEA